MGLKTYKYIKNTGCLPHFALGGVGSDALSTQRLLDNGINNKLSVLPTTGELNNLLGKLDKAGVGKTTNGSLLQTSGKKSGSFDVGGAIQGGIGLISTLANSSRPVANAQDMVNNAVGRESTIGNRTFQTYDGDSGEAAAMALANANVTSSTASGAMAGLLAGSVLGPWGAVAGTVVGGALGWLTGNKAKKAQEHANWIAGVTKRDKTDNSYFAALTGDYQDKLAKEYGDLQGQQIIHVAKGKGPDVNPITNETYKKYKVYTSDGEKYARQNAFVKLNERIWNTNTDKMYRVKTGPYDNARARLKNTDVVFSDDKINPETGNTYAKDAPVYKNIPGGLWHLTELQSQDNGELNMNRLPHMSFGGMLKNIKLPKEFLPSLFNAGIGLLQIIGSKAPLSSPRSFVINPYENILPELNKLRVNTFPIYNNNRELESKTRRAIVGSGGLSAGQIASALSSNAYNTRLANAEALTNSQLQNNQYAANAINAQYQGGAQRAAREQAAGQWDYDKYAAAHNAAMQQNQMGFYNIANAWREGYKNNWDREQFEKMYGLYAADVKNKEMYYNFLRNGGMDKPVNDLRYSKLRIDNNGLLGLRNTADTVKERSDQYYKYAVNPFSKDRLNSINIPQMSLQQLIDTQNMLVPGWSSKKSKSVKRSKK